MGATRAPQRRTSVDKAEKTVQIKDIARALGISIGTVDRALHDQPKAARQRVA